MDEERPAAGDDRGRTPDRDAGADTADAVQTPERTAYVDLDGEEPGVGDDRPPRPPIEPESVDPEHAAFVLVGVALTVGVIVGAV